MVKGRSDSKDRSPQRKRAEELLRGRPSEAWLEDREKLIHELQVHQIELEMQNDELQRTQTELEDSRQEFVDLYEFAPVGYLSLTEDGTITQLNLTAAQLLGVERTLLTGKALSSFIERESRDEFYIHLRAMRNSPEKQVSEVTFRKKDGNTFPARIESIPVMRNGRWSVRSSLTDITKQKRAEHRLEADLQALTKIHALSARTVPEGGIEPLLKEIMDAAVSIVEAQKGTLQLLEAGSLRIVAHCGHKGFFLEHFADAGNCASACGEATRRGERVIVPDVEASPLFVGTPSLAVLRQARVRSVQSTPITARSGELLGILTTQWETPHTPDEHDLWRIDLLARQAADLIESDRASEELRQSERRERERAEELATLFNAVPTPVLISHSPDGLHISGNPAAEDLLGIPPGSEISLSAPAESRPRNYRILKDGQELPNEELPARRAARGEEIADYEFTIAFDDGTSRQVVGYGTPLRDDKGQARGGMLSVVDITERKRAEDIIRQANEELEKRVQERTADVERERKRLYDVLETLPAMICLLTPDYHVAFANRSFREKFGDSEGRHCYDFCFGNEGPCEFCESYEPLRTGKPHHWEVTSPDGATIIDAYDFPFTDQDGSPLILEMDLDITDQKKAAAALRKANEELREAYDKLTHEVEERQSVEVQLRQAQKMEAIGTLAGGIAHDFNNILAGIIGFAEMAIDQSGDDAQLQHYLKIILKGGFRGRDLVRQILTFSRKTEYERMPLALSSIVRETVSLLRASLPATIVIRTDVKAGPDIVMASPSEVQQVVMNLCTNAAHAMNKTGGELSISLGEVGMPGGSAELPPGKYIELAVKDTGTGITEEVKGKMFEPFFTTKDKTRGTGLGLSVVYGIVKSLKGDIKVESAPGMGSTFRILLPLAEMGEEADTEAPLARTPHGKERVLFIDDEEFLAELGKGLLEKLGYTVTAFTDASEAIALFSKHPSKFDLVFTDMTMPGTTGLDVAKRLLERRADIPIILCTGYNDDVSAEKAMGLGIRGFLMKPLARQEMAEAVRRVLDAEADRETVRH